MQMQNLGKTEALFFIDINIQKIMMLLLSKFSSKVAEKPMVGTSRVVLHHLRVKFVKFSLKVPLLPLYN